MMKKKRNSSILKKYWKSLSKDKKQRTNYQYNIKLNQNKKSKG